MNDIVTSHYVRVEGLRLHYLQAHPGAPSEQEGEAREGERPAVVLLHGWPTSSYLWRDIMPLLARTHRVIAPDLVGFGKSDKPLDASYSFRFHERILDGLLDALQISRTALVVHDLGGPIGLYWACNNFDRISHLGLLNTIVYPEMSWAVIAFAAACKLPLLRSLVTTSRSLEWGMRIGIADRANVTAEMVAAVQAPFHTKNDRRALAKAGCSLHPKGFSTIARQLKEYQGPVGCIYGTEDRILPHAAKTMARVARELPQATVTPLDGCGHFLQEERPSEIAQHLADLLAR